MINLSILRNGGTGLRVLCLGAHSDDIEIGCGGTVLTLLRQCSKVSVRWVVFSTDERRAGEATVSADAFLTGANEREIILKRYRDGFFPYVGANIKDDFESLKRNFVPDLIFTHWREDRHQDHRLVSDLTWNTFRDHLVLEYEIPKYDGDLGQPNFFVPLEAAITDRKIELLLNSFESQRSKQWFDEETFKAILRIRGIEANSPTRLAEAFHCRKASLAWPGMGS
jgi:LmbE family N-acetylglucosaminyl deacetylase